MESKLNASQTRHKYDMQSDTWFSKNVRPMILVVIIALYAIFAILGGIRNGFDEKGDPLYLLNVPSEYVQLLGQWGMVIMSFYFGGRTVEKGIKSYFAREKEGAPSEDEPKG